MIILVFNMITTYYRSFTVTTTGLHCLRYGTPNCCPAMKFVMLSLLCHFVAEKSKMFDQPLHIHARAYEQDWDANPTS